MESCRRRLLFRDVGPGNLVRDDGLCWRADGLLLPWGDDDADPEASDIELWEDDRRLGPAHAVHEAIRAEGAGRFSHWSGTLFFSTSDGSAPDRNGRRYRIAIPSVLDEDDQARLDRLAGRLRNQRPYAPEELHRLMLLPTPAQRGQVFAALGRAFRIAGQHDRAVDQLLRAWNLGRGAELGYLAGRLQAAGRFSELWPILIRAAIQAAAAGDAERAATVLMAQHAAIYAAYTAAVPRVSFQDDVVARTAGRLLRPPAPTPAAPPVWPDGARPLRVGYLLAGHADANYSSLPDIVVDLAVHHDRREIDPCVLAFEGATIRPDDAPWHAGRAARLAETGIPLHPVRLADAAPPLAAARAAADRIAALGLDVLVTTTVTGWHFLVCALRPAPWVAGLGLGEIDMFTSPLLDLALHFTRKPTMDGLCPSVEVPPFMPTVRFRKPTQPLSASDLGVPADGVILFASGRAMKFHSPPFWRIVATALAARPQLWCVVAGIDDVAVAPWLPAMAPEVRRRIRCLGWRNDILDIYPAVAMAIDTMPNGGGYSVIEAMAAGVPAVGFRDDYLSRFREDSWRPAFERLDLADAVFAEDDEAGAVARILALADDPCLRVAEGARARVQAETLRRPERTSSAVAAALRRLTAPA
ncbi:hypothetical protein [Azospirillum sp. ST 5-10]|uniref:hypothetical protein n=1 Tax=unclassified Azospirillum TaxID=2630922 RepID=UPI003F4A4BFE